MTAEKKISVHSLRLHIISEKRFHEEVPVCPPVHLKHLTRLFSRRRGVHRPPSKGKEMGNPVAIRGSLCGERLPPTAARRNTAYKNFIFGTQQPAARQNLFRLRPRLRRVQSPRFSGGFWRSPGRPVFFCPASEYAYTGGAGIIAPLPPGHTVFNHS